MVEGFDWNVDGGREKEEGLRFGRTGNFGKLVAGKTVEDPIGIVSSSSSPSTSIMTSRDVEVAILAGKMLLGFNSSHFYVGCLRDYFLFIRNLISSHSASQAASRGKTI